MFQGMPSAWARLLMESQISKQEQQQNPQAVLDALKYYTQGENGSQQKWLQYDMSECLLLSSCEISATFHLWPSAKTADRRRFVVFIRAICSWCAWVGRALFVELVKDLWVTQSPHLGAEEGGRFCIRAPSDLSSVFGRQRAQGKQKMGREWLVPIGVQGQSCAFPRGLLNSGTVYKCSTDLFDSCKVYIPNWTHPSIQNDCTSCRPRWLSDGSIWIGRCRM